MVVHLAVRRCLITGVFEPLERLEGNSSYSADCLRNILATLRLTHGLARLNQRYGNWYGNQESDDHPGRGTAQPDPIAGAGRDRCERVRVRAARRRGRPG